MSRYSAIDHYVYPDTAVLRNKAGLKDQQALDAFEADVSLNAVLQQLLPLKEQLGRKINPNCYTPQEFESRRREPDSFVNRVLAQPVLALIGNVDGFE